jgi:NAD-dependent dihydropyrimidine dehydrogenase PreA subunit
MSKPVIDYKKCTFQKKCAEVCPMNVFDVLEDKVVVARPKDCINCKACEASCPVNAVVVEDD